MGKLVREERMKEAMLVADRAMAEFIKNLPGTIQKRTLGAISQMFGFKNDCWGSKWEVDHCNGRRSTISDWISKRAQYLFEQECHKIITDELVEELVQEMREPIIKDFKERFGRCFRDAVNNSIMEHAQEEANKLVEEMKLSLNTTVDDISESAMSGRESETELAILETEINE